MHILIRDLVLQNSTEEPFLVLSGAPRGRLMYSKLVILVDKKSEPEVLYLDFLGINLSTSSFLREAVLKFKAYCVQSELNLYPVLANINEQTIEELVFALESFGDAIFCCTFSLANKITDIKMFGILEDKQKMTFNHVKQFTEIDAPTLAQAFPAEKIGVTGWNNRLAALVSKGLLIEVKKGRSKIYRTVLEIK